MKKIEKYFNLKIEVLIINPKSLLSPILYINGMNSQMGLNNNDYNPLISNPYFSLNYPGIGNSKFQSINDFGLLFYAHLTMEFIENHQLKNIILIGDSIGGAIAALLVVLKPNIFKKIIYKSPVNPFSKDYENDFRQLLTPKNLDEWKQAAQKYYHNFLNKSLSKKFLKKKMVEISQINNFSLYADGIHKLVNDLFHNGIMQIVELGFIQSNEPYLIYGQYDQLVNIDKLLPHFQKINPKLKSFMIPKSGHSIMNDNFKNYWKTLIKIINE